MHENIIRIKAVNEFTKVLANDDFEEGLYSHLTGGYGGIDANYIRIRLRTALDIE
jgi:hypothetical protein